LTDATYDRLTRANAVLLLVASWSHRNNILHKHHTHVSIGLAYDKYSFVFVQNFENNYVEFDRPMIKVDNPAYKTDNNNDSQVNIEISGKVLGSTNKE
jgi:hypothetical protein